MSSVAEDLCVMVLSYNRPEYLLETVRSVLSMRLRPGRVVVLDNGSTAPVKEALREELDQGGEWIGADPGHPSIWNFRRAIDMADREYFMMMHDDDRLLPDFATETLGFLRSHPDVIAVATNAYVIDGQGRRLSERLAPPEKERETVFMDQADLALHYSRSFIPFPSVVYRNGFPQKVPMREEYGKVGDSLFLCQLARLGPMAFIDRPLFEYRVHGEQDSSVWPFDEIRRRDDILLEMMQGDRRLNEVRRNLAKFETKQAVLAVLTTLLGSRSLRQMIKRMDDVRSPMFNPTLIPWILMEDRRNMTLLVRKLRGAMVGRWTPSGQATKQKDV
jgi:glycosyltransferase involved in cell wall biosynthesis